MRHSLVRVVKFWSARPGSPNSSKLPPTKNHMDKGNGSTAGPRNPMGWPDLWLSSFRLVSTDLGQHLSQSSAAAQHAQHVVACTTSRTRQWRHRTISRRHVRCDRSSSRRVRDSWKARRRRTFSTRVSSMLGVNTLTRTFLKISRRSLCVQCL